MAAVPGMSEIKAKQLADYLAQFPELPAISLTAALATKKAWANDAPPPALPLLIAAVKILGEANSILLQTPDTERRPRLMRQFERMEETLVPFISAISSANPKDFMQVESICNYALKALLETRSAEKFSKKTQGELADALDTFHAALRTVTARQTPPGGQEIPQKP